MIQLAACLSTYVEKKLKMKNVPIMVVWISRIWLIVKATLPSDFSTTIRGLPKTEFPNSFFSFLSTGHCIFIVPQKWGSKKSIAFGQNRLNSFFYVLLNLTNKLCGQKSLRSIAFLRFLYWKRISDDIGFGANLSLI